MKKKKKLYRKLFNLKEKVLTSDKIEERTEYSEKMFKALFEQAGTYSMVLDPNTADGIPVILEANKSACEYHGYTRDEFIGKPVAMLDDDEGKKMVAERTAEILSGKPFFVENKHIRKDGSTFDVAVHSNRIDIGTNPPLILTTEFDISDQKRNETELAEYRDQLRELSNRLENLRESERTTLARDLHDDLGQMLTSMALNIDWLKREGNDLPYTFQGKLNEVRDLIGYCIKEVQEVCMKLRPGILDNLGIVSAMEWYLENLASRSRLQTSFTSNLENEDNLSKLKTPMYRIFQELVTNVIRHADAQILSSQLLQEDNTILLEVQDDGKGITNEQIENKTSLGLLGIKERIMLFGGNMEISGQSGIGTTIRVRFPIPEPVD